MHEMPAPSAELTDAARFRAALGRALLRAAAGGPGGAVALVAVTNAEGGEAPRVNPSALGRRLAAAVRAGDLVADLGGEGAARLAVLLPGLIQPHEGAQLAERLRRALAGSLLPGRGSAPCEVRIGLGLFPDEADTVEGLLARAGAALAAAPVRPVTQEPRAPARDPQAAGLIGALGRALLEAEGRPEGLGELSLVYQPIIDLRSGHPALWEALLRWHPGGRPVPTPRLIALAEAQGLTGPLRDYTLAEVARRVRQWRAEGRPRTVALNLSPSQCASDADLAVLLDWLADPALCADVVLEITETAPLDQEAHVRRIACLAATGVRLALDDFGTGFSRIEHLAQLPVAFLKIPETFLRRAADPRYRQLLQTLIGMGRAQGLTVIAEGVETEAELALLQALGCDMAQGHLLGRPAAEG